MIVVLSLVLWLVLCYREKSGVIRPGGEGGVSLLITGVISNIINKFSLTLSRRIDPWGGGAWSGLLRCYSFATIDVSCK